MAAPGDRLDADGDQLRITETFFSLQGESRSVGRPTWFIRLTGCPLRCRYCDTAYAFHGGEQRSIDALVEEARASGADHFTVTGGEPLAQPGCRRLLRRLCDLGGEVSLETGGALSIADIDARVVVVLDIKTPGSGESARNLWDNLPRLRRADQIKFVICDEADYRWALALLRDRRLHDNVDDVLFSPSHGELPAARLADWILRDKAPVRMQMQMHKLLWGDDARGR